MAVICPTVTAFSIQEYGSQIDNIAGFAERIHIDLMDGVFAPSRSPNVIQTWWPNDIVADIHLMYKRPLEHIETLVSIKPSLVIVHAEAEGDIAGFIQHLQKFDINVGIALLQRTSVDDARNLLELADHALIFSGDLGHFGGVVDESMLQKIDQVRKINPDIEIGWDGGANVDTVQTLVAAGVDVINVGGAIQKADNAEAAYATLVAKLKI